VNEPRRLADQLASTEGDEASLALGELIALGRAATPVLIEAAGSGSADVRRLAMEGLGTIADPASLPAVVRGLEDADGRVRSLAAVALHRLGDPRGLPALMATLDDWPDLLHSEMSRSAYELAAAGPGALPLTIPLLASEKWTDRAKAAWIIRRITSQAADDPALAELGKLLEGYDTDDTDDNAPLRQKVAEGATRWLERWTGR
jgi:HEAT repeat protein